MEWLEGKLQELQGKDIIKKVLPDTNSLERVYRANVGGAYFKERTKEAWEQAEAATVPDELRELLQKRLAEDPTVSWWAAIKDIVNKNDV